jgi:predicted amidohydrolase
MQPPLVTEAAKRGADLVVFSECVITGFDLKGVGVKR